MKRRDETTQSVRVEAFASLFRGRQDAFSRMQGENIKAIRRPVSLLQYRLHLEGRFRLGIYPLLPGGLTHFLALDFDGPQAQQNAFEVYHCAVHFELSLAWEKSKSGGVHLWLFFSAPVSARGVRLVARMLLKESAVQAEIFPKQDVVPEGWLGNCICVPLSGESVKQGRTLFIDPENLRPFPDQQRYLASLERVSPEKIEQLVDLNGLKGDEAICYGSGKTRYFSGDLLPCATRMLEGVAEGCRDVAAFRLAIHLKSRGYLIQDAEQLLQKWNATKNRPPLAPGVITAKIRSAYLRGYTGYGCEDPLILPFCDVACPIKQKMLAAMHVAEENS
jgi:TOTE conflict system, Archaeo-Eukaryotic Primase domain/Primase C terminal 1 (PriCT-1)